MANTKIRIIIADDSKFMRAILRKILSNVEEVEIIGEASNGAEALSLVTEKVPDIVFLDINMPEKDGLEVAREIKSRGLPTKVIIVTSMDHEWSRELAEKIGVDAFISKPFKPFELILTLNKVLGGGGHS